MLSVEEQSVGRLLLGQHFAVVKDDGHFGCHAFSAGAAVSMALRCFAANRACRSALARDSFTTFDTLLAVVTLSRASALLQIKSIPISVLGI
ncbi:hypothetical protein K3169_19365 [Pseudomonas phytophila]|uniref:Uncharacterized protein n=1 Tax=Pseudomonas phytophila TaxID=2867264 RepID=A0ABY6F9G0_9PSED|nr:hypothetical protein [Pseudomonas phytophila]UXZ94516.1 hypothetical protein K3169_19365 [Pseudomonas phytophila]